MWEYTWWWSPFRLESWQWSNDWRWWSWWRLRTGMIVPTSYVFPNYLMLCGSIDRFSSFSIVFPLFSPHKPPYFMGALPIAIHATAMPRPCAHHAPCAHHMNHAFHACVGWPEGSRKDLVHRSPGVSSKEISHQDGHEIIWRRYWDVNGIYIGMYLGDINKMPIAILGDIEYNDWHILR